MEDAWNTTYREFSLLTDVKNEKRTAYQSKKSYDRDMLHGLEDHLRNLGIDV